MFCLRLRRCVLFPGPGRGQDGLRAPVAVHREGNHRTALHEDAARHARPHQGAVQRARQALLGRDRLQEGELFLFPASAPRLVFSKAVVCAILSHYQNGPTPYNCK